MEKQGDLLLDTRNACFLCQVVGSTRRLCETRPPSLRELNWHQSGQGGWWLFKRRWQRGGVCSKANLAETTALRFLAVCELLLREVFCEAVPRSTAGKKNPSLV